MACGVQGGNGSGQSEEGYRKGSLQGQEVDQVGGGGRTRRLRSCPRPLKVKGKWLLGPLTHKVGKEGHQHGRSLAKRKPTRTTSKWWNNSDLL
ncbi:unnamed protein product [Sphagnum balticum]